MHHYFIFKFTLSHQESQKVEKSVKKVLKEDKRANTLKLYYTLYFMDKLSIYFKSVTLYNWVFLVQFVFYLWKLFGYLGPGWNTSQFLP